MPHSHLAQASWIACILVTIFVLWRGRTPERAAALLNGANWIANALLQPPADHLADRFAWGSFGADIAFAGAFIVLAMRVRRGWAVTLTAFLVLGVATHIGFLCDWRLSQRAYATAAYIWAYGVLGTLTYAGWMARRSR